MRNILQLNTIDPEISCPPITRLVLFKQSQEQKFQCRYRIEPLKLTKKSFGFRKKFQNRLKWKEYETKFQYLQGLGKSSEKILVQKKKTLLLFQLQRIPSNLQIYRNALKNTSHLPLFCSSFIIELLYLQFVSRVIAVIYIEALEKWHYCFLDLNPECDIFMKIRDIVMYSSLIYTNRYFHSNSTQHPSQKRWYILRFFLQGNFHSVSNITFIKR